MSPPPSTSPGGPAAAPLPQHHFYYARLRAALFLLMLLPFVVSLLLTIAGLSVFLKWPGLLWAYLVLVPLCGHALWRVARKLWWREPVLSFDAEGITDHRKPVRRIPWRTIRKLYIGPHEASTSLLIAFHGRQSMESVLGPTLDGRRLTKLENSIIAPGASWGIPLGPLACRTGEVLKLAERLHAQATGRATAPAPAASPGQR